MGPRHAPRSGAASNLAPADPIHAASEVALACDFLLALACRSGFESFTLMPPLLSPEELTVLRALMDRLIPPDDFPGAVGAGVELYVLRQLQGDLAASAPTIVAGLHQLDAEAQACLGRPFAALASEQQDELLVGLEAGKTLTAWPSPATRFFNLMVNLTAEGFYADPGNGGNQGAVSWKMLGYDPRVP